MTIEKYRIYGSREPVSRALFDEHLEISEAKPAGGKLRMGEVSFCVDYAVKYFLDATQDLLFESMQRGSAVGVDIDMASGWRAQTLDLGLNWKRHLEFTNIADPEAGFILEATFECKKRPTDSGEKRDFSNLLKDLDSAELVVKNNQVTEFFKPSDSKRFDQIAVYAYHNGSDVYARRDTVIKGLASGNEPMQTFGHRPNVKIKGRSLPPALRSEYTMIDMGRDGGPFSVREALEVLPVISELLSVVDRSALDSAYAAHVESVHYTLEAERWHLSAATRGTLNGSSAKASFPPPEFRAMAAELWERTAGADLMAVFPKLADLAAELVDRGHVSPADTFERNDGRTRVYAQASDEGNRLFVDRDGYGVSFLVGDGRVRVCRGSYDDSTEASMLFDFSVDDGLLTSVNGIVEYDDKIVGMLARTLADISSAHHSICASAARCLPAPVRGIS